MKTQSAKAKGRKLQQWVRDQIRRVFNLPDEDVSSRSMGAQGMDILLSAKAAVLFPFATECKAQENLSVWAAWKQANTNISEALPFPLLVIKRNGERPLAVLDAEIFFAMAGTVVKP